MPINPTEEEFPVTASTNCAKKNPFKDGATNTAFNFENFEEDAKAFTNSRVKRYQDGFDEIIMENAWLTYTLRKRSGHDVVVNTDNTTRANMMKYSVNSAIAGIALSYEKAVMDLRRCRVASTCSSSSIYQMKY